LAASIFVLGVLAITHHGRLDPGIELIGKPHIFDALGDKVRKVLEKARS
jgi:hypothetical protein